MEPRHDAIPHADPLVCSLCVVAIFEHCCRRSPLGYPNLANSESFCTALWCNVSASLAISCTLSRAELRTARLCSNGAVITGSKTPGEPGHTRDRHKNLTNQPQNQPHPQTHAPDHTRSRDARVATQHTTHPIKRGGGDGDGDGARRPDVGAARARARRHR